MNSQLRKNSSAISLRAVSTGEGKLRKIKESVYVETANRRQNACSGHVDSYIVKMRSYDNYNEV